MQLKNRLVLTNYGVSYYTIVRSLDVIYLYKWMVHFLRQSELFSKLKKTSNRAVMVHEPFLKNQIKTQASNCLTEWIIVSLAGNLTIIAPPCVVSLADCGLNLQTTLMLHSLASVAIFTTAFNKFQANTVSTQQLGDRPSPTWAFVYNSCPLIEHGINVDRCLLGSKWLQWSVEYNSNNYPKTVHFYVYLHSRHDSHPPITPQRTFFNNL